MSTEIRQQKTIVNNITAYIFNVELTNEIKSKDVHICKNNRFNGILEANELNIRD